MIKRCSVKPYEGNKPYIFVSYCHKDKKIVFPMIEQLAHDGYRVWYDEGIDPGSEWPEIIAKHLNGCSACIAVISENSLNSHNCRREINFALLKKKPFISVVIESVQMSLGMEMQLSATQAIFKYKLPTEKEFFEKLYEAKILSDCFGVPDPGIIVSRPADYDRALPEDLFGEESPKRETFSDIWFVGPGRETEKNDISPEEKPGSVQAEDPADPPVREEPEPEGEPPKETAAIRSWLVRVKTGEMIELNREVTTLGRSETKVSYRIVGNSLVGREHAAIISNAGRCFIIDNHSKNGTYLNDHELEPGKEYELSDQDSVRLSNEGFVFHQEKRSR